ncbi:MAG: phosphorylase, partial [Gammaproteobacteria bacterium]
GTLIIPRLIRDEAGAEYPTDNNWRETIRMRLPPAMPCVDTALVSVNKPAIDAADKHALAYRTGAEAVDMETAAVAAVAAELGVPCAALRAIADPLELALPRCVLDARCDRFLPLEIPLRLALHPRDMPALRALAHSFGAARRSLHASARCLAQTDH